MDVCADPAWERLCHERKDAVERTCGKPRQFVFEQLERRVGQPPFSTLNA